MILLYIFICIVCFFSGFCLGFWLYDRHCQNYEPLKDQLEEVIEKEDYETAGKIQKKLKRYL